MQEVENPNKVNVARAETSSGPNGSAEMVPVNAAAHNAKIEDAILHNPGDVNEKARKKEMFVPCLFFGIWCFFFAGSIMVLVFGILTSTGAYVHGCGSS